MESRRWQDGTGSYGRRLSTRSSTIGAYDVLIAGMCLAQGLVVVTSNVGEFTRVSGLQVEDWR